MFRFKPRLSRRFAAIALVCGTTITGVGAATIHRYAVSQSTGSAGATAFVQTGSASSSALQGEVASTANTSISVPFGVLGEYNPSGSTFGAGTLGVSTTGYGVAGESLSNSQPSILAYPGGTGIGLEAVATPQSTAPAIYGDALGSADGVMGLVNGSTQEYYLAGVFGEDFDADTSLNSGVEGETIYGRAGVSGIADGPTPSIGVEGQNEVGYGVFGQSFTGTGVYGVSDNASPQPSASPFANAGVYGQSKTGPAVAAESSAGQAIYAETAGSVGSTVLASGGLGVGSETDSTFVGFATTDNAFVGEYPAIAGSFTGATVGVSATESDVSGFPLELYGGSSGQTEVASVSNSGDLMVTGAVTQSSVARSGAQISRFVPLSSAPTVEDVGSGRLVNGYAAVAIDPLMSQSLDQSRAYHVFLTPEGDTKGLFVSQKTPQGFVVRETQGGRGTFDFDYRIVGAVDGRANERMAIVARPRTRSQEMAFLQSKVAAQPRRIARMPVIAAAFGPAKRAGFLKSLQPGAIKAYIPPPVKPPFSRAALLGH